MERIKLVAVVGEAGSGKDALAYALIDQLRDMGFKVHRVVAYTTRPARDSETNGINYHFVSYQDFTELVLESKIIEASEFNNWFYGTNIDDLLEDQINVEILSPEAVESLSMVKNIDLCILRCSCNDKERLIRQLNREFDPDVNEIIRRFKADNRDFYNFNPCDYAYYSKTIFTDSGLSVSEEASIAADFVAKWASKDKE